MNQINWIVIISLSIFFLPGGGTDKRQLFTGDFDKMTKGIDGSGYDAPFNDGKAMEGLEARITAVRDKYRGNYGRGSSGRENMGKDLYKAMELGPHGKMGLHLKFKTVYNSVMKAKGLMSHIIPDKKLIDEKYSRANVEIHDPICPPGVSPLRLGTAARLEDFEQFRSLYKMFHP